MCSLNMVINLEKLSPKNLALIRLLPPSIGLVHEPVPFVLTFNSLTKPFQVLHVVQRLVTCLRLDPERGEFSAQSILPRIQQSQSRCLFPESKKEI